MNVLSVDVGSGSVRVALTHFEEGGRGRVLAFATQSTRTYTPSPDFYEQRSDEIWDAVTSCVRVRGAMPLFAANLTSTHTCSAVWSKQKRIWCPRSPSLLLVRLS